MSAFGLLGVRSVPAATLRREIFLLGGRHHGDALAGAREELKDKHLTTEQRMLLRVVMMHLSSGRNDPADPEESLQQRMLLKGPVWPGRIAVIIALAALAAVIGHLSLFLLRLRGSRHRVGPLPRRHGSKNHWAGTSYG